ncbi:MAG: glycosyltransferase family protein [Bacteroidetes bacterium]|nr:glycosyltransferase family protein [Bacteroidota bacterium]
MKVVLITQARMGSSRFPGKILKTVEGKTLLEIHLNRLHKCKTIHRFLVATTINETDQEICDIALQCSWELYRGDEKDVLSRFYHSIPENEFDYVVRMTSDCTLADPTVVDEIVEYAKQHQLDYCTNSIDRKFPKGLDVEVFSYKALKNSYEDARALWDREHVTPYMTRHSSIKGGLLFTGAHYPSDFNFSNIRVTVDVPLDYAFIKQLIEQIGSEKNWREYIDLIESDELLSEMNRKVVQLSGTE